MKTVSTLLTIAACLMATAVSAQSFTSKVSRDSVAVLNARTVVLKSSLKLNELKLAEAEQEADIEQQKLKIIELQASEKAAAEESSRLSDALKAGKESDVKKVERTARKARNLTKDVNNALEKIRKQIDRVEETRTEIQTEERKVAHRDPLIIYVKNQN